MLITLSLLWLILSIATAAPKDTNNHAPNVPTTAYPLPNPGHIAAHDPNILHTNKAYYLFKGGPSIPIFKSPSLSGPWTQKGTVLDGPSTVQKQNRERPWAPTVFTWRNRVCCLYSISKSGERNSAIGVASTATGTDSQSIESEWVDHGAMINTGAGPGSETWPFNVSNAIDPAFFVDPAMHKHKPYLLYGSYWAGIFAVPLTDELRVENPEGPKAHQLVNDPDGEHKPLEGSFMSYREPFYYVWFSHGQCCLFEKQGFPNKGQEYASFPLVLSDH